MFVRWQALLKQGTELAIQWAEGQLLNARENTGIKETFVITASHIFVGSGSLTLHQEGETKLILVLILAASTHT